MEDRTGLNAPFKTTSFNHRTVTAVIAQPTTILRRSAVRRCGLIATGQMRLQQTDRRCRGQTDSKSSFQPRKGSSLKCRKSTVCLQVGRVLKCYLGTEVICRLLSSFKAVMSFMSGGDAVVQPQHQRPTSFVCAQFWLSI